MTSEVIASLDLSILFILFFDQSLNAQSNKPFKKNPDFIVPNPDDKGLIKQEPQKAKSKER